MTIISDINSSTFTSSRVTCEITVCYGSIIITNVYSTTIICSVLFKFTIWGWKTFWFSLYCTTRWFTIIVFKFTIFYRCAGTSTLNSTTPPIINSYDIIGEVTVILSSSYIISNIISFGIESSVLLVVNLNMIHLILL